jgi:hypothetical protein
MAFVRMGLGEDLMRTLLLVCGVSSFSCLDWGMEEVGRCTFAMLALNHIRRVYLPNIQQDLELL